MASGRLALGLEFSTQSVKAVVLDSEGGNVVYSDKFEYDRQLPGYGTEAGVLPSSIAELRHTSPLMMIEALDMVFQRLKGASVTTAEIGAVKLDAMQHGSVYLSGTFENSLSRLSGGDTLLSQLANSFTRASIPIWEDRTTGREAQDMTEALRHKGGIESLTGNRAELRFPGPQILRWAREDGAAFDRTAKILLLSTFLTSILAGRVVPVDTGDGWGTNLNSLDIDSPSWSGPVLESMDELLRNSGAAGTLAGKLGEITDYDAPVGTISPYFVEKFGINPAAAILAGTGDNPATLLGAGGEAVISLGSSYTVNGVMSEVVPSTGGEYNVFGFTPGRAMALSVFTNGAKLHDRFLRTYLGQDENGEITTADWEKYKALAGGVAATGKDPLMLPYLFAESVPTAPAGIVRDGFDETDAAANVRALHLSQAVSLRLHSSHLADADSICVVGGSARNDVLRQMITDAFGVETYMILNSDVAAPLGCAISAARHLLGISYEEAASRFVQRDEASTLHPDPARRSAYAVLQQRYSELERRNLAKRPI